MFQLIILPVLLWKVVSCYGEYSSKSNNEENDKYKYLKYSDNDSSRSLMKQLGVVVNGLEERLFVDPIGCKIYLAESSIPKSGLGMYSAVNISNKDSVGHDESVVAFFDADNSNLAIEDYTWSAGSLTPPVTNEAKNVTIMIPGIGAAANSARGLTNTHLLSVELKGYEPPGYSDLEAGASNEYKLVRWKATKDIPQGMEIFADYGDSYFKGRTIYDDIPLTEDYEVADTISSKFMEKITFPEFSSLTQEEKQTMWEEKINTQKRRVRSALPINVTSLKNLVRNGSALFSLLPDVIRTPEWLEENGQCMDNIMPKPSKLPYAGVGAFATRYILKNSLVAPVPLAIINKKYLNMYELIFHELKPPEKSNHFIGYQLLLNYCFGHMDSPLLFFPYSSSVNFINHSSKKANAEIRWSNNDFHQPEWLHLPPDEIYDKRSGLIFDIIATKDIYPGDEIYIDYGKDWEEAWNTYVSQWKPSPSSYVSLRYFDKFQNVTSTSAKVPIIRTIKEQKVHPYPENIRTGCHYKFENENKKSEYTEANKVSLDLYWEREGLILGNEKIISCDVLERKTSFENYNYYTVRVYKDDFDQNDEFPLIVHDVPRVAIEFINHRYTSNQAKKNTFRHFIGIPDDMVPSQWKGHLDKF